MDPDNKNSHDQSIYGWLYLAYAVLQTAGLLLISVANVDGDLHVRQSPKLAVGVAIVVIVYSCLEVLEYGVGSKDLVSWCERARERERVSNMQHAASTGCGTHLPTRQVPF